jgi:hypothetical protein
MGRPIEEILDEIVDMTPEERGHLIARIGRMERLSDADKAAWLQMIMLVSNIGDRCSGRAPN